MSGLVLCMIGWGGLGGVQKLLAIVTDPKPLSCTFLRITNPQGGSILGTSSLEIAQISPPVLVV